jgi:hypothetical protein
MQEKSFDDKTRLLILLVLFLGVVITSYKDLKDGFVEGYNSYNLTKSINSKQQSSLIGTDFFTLRLMLLNKVI